jgi:chromosome segregation ATPase
MMNIEDFKKIVADYQVGDELKLEVLCSVWNREADNAAVEELLSEFREQIDDLEDTVKSQQDEIERLNESERSLEGEIRELEISLEATEINLKNCEEVLKQCRLDLSDGNKKLKEAVTALGMFKSVVIDLIRTMYRMNEEGSLSMSEQAILAKAESVRRSYVMLEVGAK